MDSSLFINKLIFGFPIAAPVGQIGEIRIHRTISDDRLAGLVTGQGAVSADAIYGSYEEFGITFISNFLLRQYFIFRFFGRNFIFCLAIKTFRIRPVTLTIEHPNKGNLSAYLTTFLLTLTNLMIIISIAAIFHGLELAETSTNYSPALLLILGGFFGSASWWFLLTTITGSFHSKFNIASMRLVNRFSGLIILSFGIYALISRFL